MTETYDDRIGAATGESLLSARLDRDRQTDGETPDGSLPLSAMEAARSLT